MIDWKLLASNTPPQDISLLVRMLIPFPVYDVAVYRGVHDDGHRWILADVRLDHGSITHWALVDDPDDAVARLRITPVREIGAYRPLCETTIRVAAGIKTTAAQRGAYQRKRLGVPVDQCGARSDFRVNGKPICRAHAGQLALAHLLAESQ